MARSQRVQAAQEEPQRVGGAQAAREPAVVSSETGSSARQARDTSARRDSVWQRSR